ncbi:MAG: TetR/AcrR family transcriptional regulator [Balneolaceae bacterium]|nr:TetR/AcrR family transcriptional regulator [Balneolaceae bacterium]
MSRNNNQDLRDKLLQSARELLVSKGYRGFSLRQVARETGVSATSVYIYFENKDHLIHTLIEQSISELNERLEKVYGSLTDPEERLKGFAEAYVNYALEHPREYQIIYLASPEDMTRYPKEKFRKARRGYEFLTDTIKEAVRQDIFDEPYPRTAAYTFWAQLHGVMSVVLSKRLDTRIDQQEFIEQAISHILHGFQMRTALQQKPNI